ncbi:amidase [Sporolactobacillus nakayamae]|uniref:Aspartyl-tRNA(Asn)/glutamyl-tRNA(Gln) amidotransferase subunit A n=1 Tax=Sporolactobacillus nakayamae TaxID=269670 RepID=A0A1I2W8E8_9BACL|nr:amidase [Sporolactobacillus nakayamae]SFG96909.1 aspartyl-tRNA(Asn)/glutamyl-tRNA(Gln) amidotransferase subunit A [Sporolactobacillus nakayamae]
MNIHELSADALLAGYRSKILSPVEVVRALFKYIEESNAKVNAFVTLNKEQALIQARESEKRYAEGVNIRALEGIPVAIKDLVNTKGIRTTYGCLAYKDHVPDRDATVVTRVKDAGAVIMGKTNTPEFGFKGTTENPLFGPSRNPWNLTKQTGGSSGGAAAAIASGFIPIAQGGDGGGSIRIPASLCGVYGFKSTFGRVPIDNNVNDVFGSHNPFIHWGPIARTVTDAALMFDVIQGDAPTDPFSLPRMNLSIYETLKTKERSNFVIGYTPDFGIFEIEEEIKSVFLKTIDRLRELGLKVEPMDIQMKKTEAEYVHYFDKVWTTHLSASAEPLLENHADELSDGLKNMIQRARGLSAIDFDKLGGYRSYLYQTIQHLFDTYDVVLSPTLVSSDIKFDAFNPEQLNGHAIDQENDWTLAITSIFNLTGHPAASLPVGFTKEGVPIGMQAICKRLDDVTLFQFAKWIENHINTPTLASLK